MSDLNPPTPAQPHERNWFFDLFSYFGRTQHPLSAEDDAEAMADLDLPDVDSQLQSLLDMGGANRQKRMKLFEEMDSFGLIESILDLFAEESTQPDYEKQKRIWIESNAKHMIDQGDRCLHNVQAEDRIPMIARSMSKYGDHFRRLVYESSKGVLGWKSAKAEGMERREDRFSRLVGFKEAGKKYRGKKREVSWPWDYVHFRLMGKNDDDLYGTSLLEAMFRPWRQLALTEDSMLMYRLRRMPDRNAIFVNVGNMEAVEGAKWLNTYRKKFRKHEYVDPASPAYKKQFNPLTPLEDVFIPVRQGDEIRVETLQGGGNIGEIYDLEYYRDAFFGTAKVPKAYLGFEGDINAKATLIQQDVRFARTCKRIRHSLIYGLRQLLDIHFILSAEAGGENKWDPTKKENAYTVMMAPISYLDEFERLELMQLRYQIVETMSRLAQDMQLDSRVWATYILLNFAKLPEDLVLKLINKAPDAVSAANFERTLSPKGRAAFRNLDEDVRDQILDKDGKQREGFYQLSEAEMLKISEAVHKSPGIRKVIGDIAYYFAGSSGNDLVVEAEQQTDPSVVPPKLPNGSTLTSESEDNEDVKQLHEDLQSLKQQPPIEEATT